eukprot:CAMPEP_0172655008 /NCGR_PEP_ID=MMETSP1074-20121228/329_1 /TAXON_ID=2916 /ORGANISM="Ceratium fusus, Strain PA161109" /LENGTH=224 /DNA_ID=CAMNT_0013469531 /DNA_START=257 /DNA_END=928 /DNA_ORIENTATION=-
MAEALTNQRHAILNQMGSASSSCESLLSPRHQLRDLQQLARLSPRTVCQKLRGSPNDQHMLGRSLKAQLPTCPGEAKLNAQMLPQEARSRVARISSAPSEARLDVLCTPRIVYRSIPRCQHQASLTGSNALGLHGGIRQLKSAAEVQYSKAASTEHGLPTTLVLTSMQASKQSSIAVPTFALPSKGNSCKGQDIASAESKAMVAGLSSEPAVGEDMDDALPSKG